MLEIKYLENESKNILQQVEDLKTTILKFTNGKRTLDLLFGNQKLVDDKNGIQFTEDTNLSFKSQIHLNPYLPQILTPTLSRMLYLLLWET